MTDPDTYVPREDGYFPHRAVWGEVVVGVMLEDPGDPRKRWEVIDCAMETQVADGRTLFMRAREVQSGAEFTITPRMKSHPVTILTKSPRDTVPPPPTAPSDAEAIWLLVKKLGATNMGTRCSVTGEIVCPDYDSGRHHLPPGDYAMQKAETEHLRVAHGMKVPDGTSIERLTTLHGRAHKAKADPADGGFPHRHVPEDLTLFTGRQLDLTHVSPPCDTELTPPKGSMIP